MEPNELIVCRDASLGYEGQSVLAHLDLTIRAGDYLCIVGDNGSGKSTLLRGLLGLLSPQSGEILRAPELRQGAVGYLPQQTRAQRDFPATVYEVVLSGCLNQKGLRFFYTAAQKSAALMNMGKLGILELKDQSYRDLSGGQQQRVLLARALCQQPEVIVLDEPTSYLDIRHKIELLDILREMTASRGLSVVLSLHPHNDEGMGVAATELAVLAGADRVEGCLLGNGERTGNVDMVTLALNLYTQGVDPKLDFSDINKIRDVYERVTKMKIGERQPYVGELVFTAFSGSHQDAINKGTRYMEESGTEYWEVPYLPIDPADVGRQYEPIIRINSQSGKGGSAFVMQHSFGFDLPKAMHPEFGHIVQVETDRVGKELKPDAIYDLFKAHYIDAVKPYQLVQHSFAEFTDEEGHSHVTFWGTLQHTDTIFKVSGDGNGPIDAFFNAIHGQKMDRFTFIDYKEHAVKQGSDSQAVAYIHLQDENGRDWFGVGMSHNINLAPLKGILSAINRAVSHDGK